jgi:hypothetical protein
MAKKMLGLEEIETQMVLELPDRQLMRVFDMVRDFPASDIVRYSADPRDIACNLVGFGSWQSGNN